MASLEEPQSRFLAGVRRRQRPIAIGGALLALAGAAYLAWGVLRYDPMVDPRKNPGFDGPVANLAFIFERGMILVENATPQTPSEARDTRTPGHLGRSSGEGKAEHTSARAAFLLLQYGFEKVMPILGGLQAWEDAGYPVETGSN